ncbi:hypothetical protein AB0M87_23260 [Streptomyces sp. NPDC051320]|uniref:hypothetical protein n=1 Tax=Streptomyces sp. NPDC051320 TaxID=3154644 RepID=UPI00343954AD
MTGEANDGWTQTVRSRIGLGRLLPLGGVADGAWIAERAAAAVLLRVADEVGGLCFGQLRIAAAGPGPEAGPAIPAPPGALPPGPLRIDAEVDVIAAAEPLPALVDRWRDVLLAACVERLGLAVTAVDVRVTGLLDAPPPRRVPIVPDGPAAAQRGHTVARGPAANAAVAVPGVARLTGVLGSPVQVTDGHVQIELAVAPGYRPVDVASAVRRAVAAVTAGAPTVGAPKVGVLVTEVELP